MGRIPDIGAGKQGPRPKPTTSFRQCGRGNWLREKGTRMRSDYEQVNEIDRLTELLEEQAARVRGLTAENERLQSESAESVRLALWNAEERETAESRLAAATALLERVVRRGPTRGDGLLNGDIQAFLANQPAAPARTEAEQHVIDAARSSDIMHARYHNDYYGKYHPLAPLLGAVVNLMESEL